MEGCEVGVLIDLSEPTPLSPPVADGENKKCSSPIITKCRSPLHAVVSKSPITYHQTHSGSEDGDFKENSNPLFDSIEIGRSYNCKSNEGLICPGTPQNLCNKALRDITNDDEGWNFLKLRSPVTKLIADESFDFDFTLSPSSMRSKNVSVMEEKLAELDEDEDEVFIGPVGFTEKCVAVNVQEEADKVRPLTPLSADKFAQIRKEALMVAIRFGQKADADSETEENQPPKSCKELKFSSETNECFSPSKQKHVRGQTFTVSKMLSEVLPGNIDIPVISCDDDIQTVKSENGPVKAACDKSSKEDKENSRSRLVVPKSKPPGSKLPRDRSKTKLPVFGSTEKINVEISSGIDTDDTCSVASDISDTSTVCNSKLPTKKSGIAQLSKTKNSGLKKPSKLKPPSSNLTNRSFNSSNESLNSAASSGRKLQPPKASIAKSTPGEKAVPTCTKPNSEKKGISQPKTGIPSSKGPLAKKSLLEPSALQKPKWAAGKGKVNTSSLPMKATVAAKNDTSKKDPPAKPCTTKPETKTTVVTEDIPTPVKPEKRVEPKLLSQKFSTPVRSSSTSSCTPMSNRRRSCLPTPQRTRPTSLSSLPPQSPLALNDSTRKLSQSSRKSSYSSVSESPVPSQRKPSASSARKSISGINQLAAFGSTTPCAFKKSANPYSQGKMPKSTEHPKPSQKTSVKMVSSSEVKAKVLGRRSYHVYQTIHE